MKILGIETSCDETAAAVVQDGVEILSNVVVSQIDIFAEYGGVIPEVAARSHLEVMMPVIKKALADAKCTWDDIDAIAVTYAPGLLGSLLIGTLTARTLAILHDKPLYAVHHLKSHVYANWVSVNELPDNSKQYVMGPVAISHLRPRPSGPSPWADGANPRAAALRNAATLGYWRHPSHLEGRENTISDCKTSTSSAKSHSAGSDTSKEYWRQPSSAEVSRNENSGCPEFPILALVVSGGHTQILYMPAHNKFEIIGTTRDDAVGECFDKVAKILGLPYPGGPSIAKAASGEPVPHIKANSEADSVTRPVGDPNKYKFPHPKIEGLDFSFSGLKTAVLRAVQKELGLPISHPSYDLKNHLSAQQVADFAASFQKTAVDILVEKLQMALEQYPDVKSVVVAGGVSANKLLREALPEAFFPAPKLSGDNGAMVAAAAYYEIISGVEPTDPYTLNIYPRISIEE